MHDYPLLFLIWLVPLASAVLLFAFGPQLRSWGGPIGAAAIGVAFVAALAEWGDATVVDGAVRGAHQAVLTWLPGWSFGLQWDRLSLVWTMIITGVGFLIHVYSIGYLAGDRAYPRFFAYMNFFVFAMLTLVLSDNFVGLLVGWGLVGLASYLLIGWYFERPSAVAAARKAFVINVVGDVGILYAIFVIVQHTGSISYADVFGNVAKLQPDLFVICLGLFIGCAAKSAQVPLHTWLPDAYSYAPAGVTAVMAGATKAGSLLALVLSLAALPSGGAAVFAGIALLILAVLTMTAGNILALAQTDIRRLLAYSSIAQMGYILLPFGIGLTYGLATGILAGLFYAVAYGLMKAGAFLSADLLAADAGSSDTARMKGVGGRNPAVGVAFSIFILGLIGVPATAGFVGKALIFLAGMSTLAWGGVILALVLAANSALSLGYYVPLLSTVLFSGQSGEGDGGAPVKAIPLSGTIAVVLLALMTVILGFFPGAITGWLGSASALFPWGAI